MMTLLWFLLWVGVFVLMMRFGCGAHMAHAGNHTSATLDGHDHGPTPSAASDRQTAVDPVCGMPVPVDQGYAEMYQGHLLRFCSRKCLDTFDAAPQHYAG